MSEEQIKILSKEEILRSETIQLALSSAEDELEEEDIKNQLFERAKELRCYQQVRSIVKAVKEKLKSERKQNIQDTFSRTTAFNYYENDVELKCGAWVADDNGIRLMTERGEVLASHCPITIVKRFTNIQDGTERVQIAYKRDGEWNDIVVEKSYIASATKIVGLANERVPVTSETARYLVKYLYDLECLNHIPITRSTSKLGWIDGRFLPFDRDIEFDAINQYRDLYNSITECGDYNTWLDLAKRLRAMPRFEPQLYMAVSFASVLAEPLSCLPFIANLWGDSGNGKTVLLMLATSIWANPEPGKYITDSYSTKTAFEARLDVLNNLPMMLDDMSKIKDAENDGFAELIYLLCNGIGKGRSNTNLTINATKNWRLAVLSNMERPLAKDTMRGGAINRILDFAMDQGKIFNKREGNRVSELLRQNYGFAGRMFVDAVSRIGVKKVKEIQQAFVDEIAEEAKRQDSVKEDKQVIPLSIILTADKIATNEIFKDGLFLNIPKLVGFLKDVDEVSEGKRGYEYIISFVLENLSAFTVGEETRGDYRGREYGYIEGDYVYIYANVMAEITKAGNFDKQAFCSWAEKKNLVVLDHGHAVQKKRYGRNARVYQVYWSKTKVVDANTEIER